MLDLREADPYAPNWWSSTKAVLQAMQDSFEIDLSVEWSRYWQRRANNPRYKKESREKFDEVSVDRLMSAAKLLFPWVNLEDNKKQTNEDKMREAWVDFYGDPNDPEVAARIERTAAMLRGET